MPMLSERLNTVPFLLRGEPEFLASLVRKLPDNPVILEIGTFRGLSAVIMAQQRKDAKIITIDPHIGIPEENLYSNPYIVEHNFKKYGVISQITHLPLSSNDYYPDIKFDLLFIDGDHSYKWVAHDYYKFEQAVKEGGLIVFHDFGAHKGVTEFCANLIHKKKFQCKSLFVIQK